MKYEVLIRILGSLDDRTKDDFDLSVLVDGEYFAVTGGTVRNGFPVILSLATDVAEETQIVATTREMCRQMWSRIGDYSGAEVWSDVNGKYRRVVGVRIEESDDVLDVGSPVLVLGDEETEVPV